ncbi:hypothetical protein [Micromonospora inyonensis]|uniref:Uncharacterized protein n=1 Tax=Micromonospora inyonensis TaxID=47866 RepID=A0A1C6RD96_9ACTN|nr:hypothetical protein [Micromonospora inyonensis]SCL15066.1 hypothetical protein GA0074694_1038 [Micromonospora inyonensis]
MVSASAVALTGDDQQIATGPAIYRGYAVRATTAAVVRIWDGTEASGTLLDVVALDVDATAAGWYGGGGIRAGTGVHVEVVSGTVEGSVRIG